MSSRKKQDHPSSDSVTRRDVLKLGLAGTLGGMTLGMRPLGAQAPAVHTAARGDRPNMLFILTDQQHIDTIRAGGCKHVKTPAMDRLFNEGTHFTQSYCPHPVCSPCRGSIFSGHTSTEAGTWINGIKGGEIREDFPTIGEYMRTHSNYETYYAGKWHVPHCHTYNIRGFDVLATGVDHWGDVSDAVVSRACARKIMQRDTRKPFFMVASLINPHDICMWLWTHAPDKGSLPYPELSDELPPLPPNFNPDPDEPESLREMRAVTQQPAVGGWDEDKWRYYLWVYYRHVEMVDAEIGVLLDALDASGQAEDTVVVLTSDHGEGMGEHRMVRKDFHYDSAQRVPLIFTWPGRAPAGMARNEIVSGLDLAPTFYELGGMPVPESLPGKSLKTLVEGKASAPWTRPCIVTESAKAAYSSMDPRDTSRMVRTDRFKYIKYYRDEVDQLFDMHNDPLELKNLAMDRTYVDVVREHRELLVDWERGLDLAPRVAEKGTPWRELEV